MNNLTDTYFHDYEIFTENDIVEITVTGISMQNGMFIDFSECSKNYEKANPEICNNCVGDRDITDWSFTFYTSPKSIMIKFLPKGKLAEFFSRNDTFRRFHALQFKIHEMGFRTRDMS